MSKKEPSLSTQYRRVLTSILATAQKNHHLWDHAEYIPGALLLFSGEICAQDNDYMYYGITQDKKGRFAFCREEGRIVNPLEKNKDGVNIINISQIIEELERYDISIERLKSHFLENITEPLRRYEILNAGIDEKVKRKLKNLEKALE